ncbi:hypothetical protein ASZ90_014986 [hydrocarbon metagenome]|uniref:Uncharacterized protein n=1 Tax=hydrocarbon metagenome TaxID=938273 RepID=A0A0W8F3B6_9ZZZZ
MMECWKAGTTEVVVTFPHAGITKRPDQDRTAAGTPAPGGFLHERRFRSRHHQTLPKGW